MNYIKEDLEIVDAIINGVTQMDMWAKNQHTDPTIIAAESELEASLNKLKGTPHENLIDEIYWAVYGLAGSFETLAFLCGMRTARAIHEAVSNPLALSQFVADRTANLKKEFEKEKS